MLSVSVQIHFICFFKSTKILNVFSRVAKNHTAAEYIKLEWIKQIGLAHMRILEGATSLLQLTCLVAKLCHVVLSANE